MSNAAKDLLHATPVSQVVPSDRTVISVSTKDSLWSLVKKLDNHHIQSCPVLNDDGTFEGFVDVGDVTNYIVACAPDPASLESQPIESLEIAGRVISLVPVSRVRDMSSKNSTPVFMSDPTTHVCSMFTTTAHHAVLVDESHKVINVCSQSDVVKFLASSLPDSMKNLPLSKFGYGHCDVFTISEKATVLTALQKLSAAGVGALAVVDADGKLKGNFSASDLKGLYKAGKLPRFTDPVISYLEAHSPASLVPVLVSPEKSLSEAVTTLTTNKVHHAWVVDAAGKPAGLVSHTDIINLVMSFSG